MENLQDLHNRIKEVDREINSLIAGEDLHTSKLLSHYRTLREGLEEMIEAEQGGDNEEYFNLTGDMIVSNLKEVKKVDQGEDSKFMDYVGIGRFK